MKKIIFILCGVLSVLVLTSCHPVIGLEITNNTGEPITVISVDAATNETNYPLADGQTTDVKVGLRLRVKHGLGIWDYDFPPPPPKRYLKRLSLNVYVERIQLQKGGEAWLLAPDSPLGPSTELPSQPSGYPIRPH